MSNQIYANFSSILRMNILWLCVQQYHHKANAHTHYTVDRLWHTNQQNRRNCGPNRKAITPGNSSCSCRRHWPTFERIAKHCQTNGQTGRKGRNGTNWQSSIWHGTRPHVSKLNKYYLYADGGSQPASQCRCLCRCCCWWWWCVRWWCWRGRYSVSYVHAVVINTHCCRSCSRPHSLCQSLRFDGAMFVNAIASTTSRIIGHTSGA